MPGSTGPDAPRRIGRYEVLGLLGSGGQGVVRLARGPDGERVAIKQLLAVDDDTRAQLRQEVAAARRVAPFCVARVLDADVDAPVPYVVSEYVEGPSLRDRVARDGPLDASTLHWTAIGTAVALTAIHEAGVVHRDLTPGNVLLAADGPRVIDFGIARHLWDPSAREQAAGTPGFAAPEQVRGDPARPAADVFAWACVVVFAATGQHPFPGATTTATLARVLSGEPVLDGVPSGLLPVLRACLARDPAARPSAHDVVARLLGGQASAEATTRQLATAAGVLDRTRVWDRPAGRSGGRRWLGPAAVAVLLVALVLWWGSVRDGDPTDARPATPSPTASPTPSPTPAVPIAASVPADLAGTWSGTAIQPGGEPGRWTLRLELDEGLATGRFAHVEQGCSGVATPVAGSDGQLDLDLLVDDDPQRRCPGHATVRINRLPLDRATLFWRDRGNALTIATGVLVKR